MFTIYSPYTIKAPTGIERDGAHVVVLLLRGDLSLHLFVVLDLSLKLAQSWLLLHEFCQLLVTVHAPDGVVVLELSKCCLYLLSIKWLK